MTNDVTPPLGQFILFETDAGQTKVECLVEAETLWLTQADLCQLYGKSKATISEHITNIFNEQELAENAAVRLFRTTAEDGKNYNTKHFSSPLIN